MSRIDPSGLDWSTSIKLTWQWFTGTGIDMRVFGPGSSSVDEMKDAPGVQAA